MYEQFGTLIKQKKVEFQLFLPDLTQYVRGGDPQIKEIRIIGDFQNKIGGKDWDPISAPLMTQRQHPQGWLYTYKTDQDLPDGFYQYKYYVTFQNQTTRWVTDPCAKLGGNNAENENSAFVIGGNTTVVKPIKERLPLKDLIIYELMIDNFTAGFRGVQAPIDAIKNKLDYLQNLGVNAIEFMPWTAWSGSNFSWGYDPFQFFSVEYRYIHDPATPYDKLSKLKTLINELHARTIHVIMDGVFNHVTSNFPYLQLYQNPSDSPFIGQFGEGGFFEELDYHNHCTQEFIRDVCAYWFDVYQIDGIRFDYTRGFYDRDNPEVGIRRLITDVKGHLATTGKENVSLILEHLTDNRFDAINDTNKIGASGCWFDPFMFKLVECARNGNIDDEILRILDANRDFVTDKAPVTYIENHDHSTVICEVGGRSHWFKTQPAAIALLTSPGAVMLHNGQEFGEDYYLPNSGDDRVIPRPLHWDYCNDPVGQTLYSLYQRLIQIRNAHPALRSPNFFPTQNTDGYGAFQDKGIVIYRRSGHDRSEKFIVVINYTDSNQQIDIPFPANGVWEDLLNERTDQVNDHKLLNQKINPNWGRIYYQNG